MFGTFQEAIRILEDVKNRTKSDLGKAVLDQAIFYIEQAEQHEQIQFEEYNNQFFKCHDCAGLVSVRDLRQFFNHGKTRELCPNCEDNYKINKLT